MSTSPEHIELVRKNLELVAHIESAREAADLLGVAAQTVIDWRAGRIAKPREPTPTKLLSNLKNGIAAKRERKPVAGIGVDNADFWRRYDAIEASGLPEPIKVHKIDAIAAVIRALAHDKDAAAAERRTRALETEVEAGRERTREISRVERRAILPSGPLPRPEKPQPATSTQKRKTGKKRGLGG